MPMPRKHVKTFALFVAGLAIVLASVGHWIASGCPVGYHCASCQTNLGDIVIFGASDHLLTGASLTSDKDSAELDLGGWHIKVCDGSIAIDGNVLCSIPGACRKLEFIVAGRAFGSERTEI